MIKFDFIGNSKKFFIFSCIVILAVVLCSFIIGVQLDIQFRGGSMITYAYDGDLTLNAFTQKVVELYGTETSVQQSTDIASGLETMVVSMPGTQSLTSDEMAALTESLHTAFPQNNLRSVQISNVNPTIGGEFLAKSFVAVAFASILMVLYVTFRFRRIGGMSAGVMGVVALLHDVIIAYGVFVVCGFPLNDNFIAVVLTILGFSINDTIVIYDRIRENKRLMGPKTPVSDLVNHSIQQSFSRSINTSLCSVAAMLIITVVAYIYRVESIITFSLPLTVGLIFGTYSSICIAGPLWVKWQERKLKKVAA